MALAGRGPIRGDSDLPPRRPPDHAGAGVRVPFNALSLDEGR